MIRTLENEELAGPESCKVDVEGGQYRLAVRSRATQGDDLIVFIHGLACSQKSFRAIWDYALLKGYSLLTFDLLGFGSSDKPTDFSYQLESQAKVCQGVLSKFPSKRVHVVAHSMGGAIGLILTKTFTPFSFVSIEGNLVGADCYITRNTQRMSESDFCDTGFAQLTKTLSGYPDKSFELENTLALAFYRSATSLVQWCDSGSLLDLFASLNIPKLYIYGESNADLPVMQEISGIIQTKQIPASGHFPMVENPDSFYSAIAKFITSAGGMS
jgi:pimeloyl-ACP methyl ester carboxylesterase